MKSKIRRRCRIRRSACQDINRGQRLSQRQAGLLKPPLPGHIDKDKKYVQAINAETETRRPSYNRSLQGIKKDRQDAETETRRPSYNRSLQGIKKDRQDAETETRRPCGGCFVWTERPLNGPATCKTRAPTSGLVRAARC
jgi:hypothetical protein